MPSISFYIPAYNCEKWVEEAVDSIMETNFEDGDELVICNDGSTDNTAEVLVKIQNKYLDKDIKIVTHKYNKGISNSRNTAIENTKYEILFCLDSDNVLEKNSIKPLKEFMLKEKADIASFGELKYFQDGTPKEKTTHSWVFKEPDFTLQDAFSTYKTPSSSGNYMYTKEIWRRVHGFISHAWGMDNWSFGFLALVNGAKMVVLKDTYYFHRYAIENSSWSDFAKKTCPSLHATGIIMPYLDIFTKESVEYILNKGRYTWLDNLESHPIKLKTEMDIKKEQHAKERKQKILRIVSCFVPVKKWRRKIRSIGE